MPEKNQKAGIGNFEETKTHLETKCIGLELEKVFCLRGEGQVGLCSISDKGNLIQLKPAQLQSQKLNQIVVEQV